MSEITYIPITFTMYQGEVYPHHGHEIEVVGRDIDTGRPVVKVVGTYDTFVLEGNVVWKES